jgi:hypothetical protein
VPTQGETQIFKKYRKLLILFGERAGDRIQDPVIENHVTAICDGRRGRSEELHARDILPTLTLELRKARAQVRAREAGRPSLDRESRWRRGRGKNWSRTEALLPAHAIAFQKSLNRFYFSAQKGLKMSDAHPRKTSLPIALPDTSIAIPRNDQRRDLYPIRQPDPPKFPRRPSLAMRRRRRLVNS